jgi:lipooligosaccharide transport system ATP-binding protein
LLSVTVDDEILLSATGLTKRFGDFTAVDGIDFGVRKGECFGFLGPNGAGKSSTMRMVGCVSPVTEGELRLFGLDPATDGPAIRARLGSCPQRDTLDEELTVEENLWIYGRYFGLSRHEVRSRAAELLDFAQLTDRAKDRVEPLSGGMKRRLTIARSLINSPEILLLDEPTTGLDPRSRLGMWDIIRSLAADGTTLLLTTQYLDEADELADEIVVIDHGLVIAAGTAEELKGRVGGDVVEFTVPDRNRIGEAVTAVTKIGESDPLADSGSGVVSLRVGSRGSEALVETVRALDAAGVETRGLGLRRPSLDDVFLALTGHATEEEEPGGRRRGRRGGRSKDMERTGS